MVWLFVFGAWCLGFGFYCDIAYVLALGLCCSGLLCWLWFLLVWWCLVWRYCVGLGFDLGGCVALTGGFSVGCLYFLLLCGFGVGGGSWVWVMICFAVVICFLFGVWL